MRGCFETTQVWPNMDPDQLVMFLVNEITANEIESKTRAQMLDLIEVVTPEDKKGPAKRMLDQNLKDLVQRIRERIEWRLNAIPKKVSVDNTPRTYLGDLQVATGSLSFNQAE